MVAFPRPLLGAGPRSITLVGEPRAIDEGNGVTVVCCRTKTVYGEECAWTRGGLNLDIRPFRPTRISLRYCPCIRRNARRRLCSRSNGGRRPRRKRSNREQKCVYDDACARTIPTCSRSHVSSVVAFLNKRKFREKTPRQNCPRIRPSEVEIVTKI